VDKARQSAQQLLILVTMISLVIMVIMYLGRGFIVHVVFGQIEPDVANYSTTYMNIVFASIPFIAIYNAGAALFRSMGNSRITMFTSILMNIINVIGNAICIYGLNLHVSGVAIPTLVSRGVAAFLIISLLMNKELIVYISRPFHLKFDPLMVRNILKLGIPNGIENSLFQLGKILLLSVVAAFGTASITANAVGNSISAIGILPGAAIGLGLITVVSRCVGAGDYEQVRYYTKKLLNITYIAFVLLNLTIMLSLPLIIDIYNLSEETAKMASQVIILHGVFGSMIWPLAFTLPNALRAANDVRYAMKVGVLTMWVFRIGFGILLAKVLNMGLIGVWIAMIIDWVFRTLFFVTRYRGKKWEVLTLS
jgi:putative MATE family efflux protein